MKVKIDESSDFVCPGYLTVGKVYEARVLCDIGFDAIDDVGDLNTYMFKSCLHLNGGNWIEVTEC
jgi:hypothetical protein